jgi:hypothetical protein
MEVSKRIFGDYNLLTGGDGSSYGVIHGSNKHLIFDMNSIGNRVSQQSSKLVDPSAKAFDQQ